MEDFIFSRYNPVDWWIDRIGNMEFIEDQKLGAIMQPAFWQHMIRLSDKAQVNPSCMM